MIKFKKVSALNFMSYDEMILTLNHRGVTLVHGANGAGKSSLYEALLWGLFGKTLRGTTEVGQIGSSATEVRVCFILESGQRIHVTRWRTKDKTRLLVYHELEADQEEITAGTATLTQALIEDLLHADFKTFVAATCFGGSPAYRFSSLTDVERLDVLNRVLDVEVYGQAAKLAKRDHVLAEVEVTELGAKLEGLRRTTEVLEQRLADIDEAEDVDVAKLDKQIALLVKVIGGGSKEAEFRLDKAQESRRTAEAKLSLITSRARVAAKDLDTLLKQKERAGRKEPCTLCGSLFAWDADGAAALKLAKERHQAEIDQISDAEEVIEGAEKNVKRLRDRLQEVLLAEAELARLKQDRQNANKGDEARSSKRREVEKELAAVKQERLGIREAFTSAKGRAQRLDYVRTLLGSEVPRAAVEGAIPVLNQRAAEVARFLGGPGFSVAFATSRETKVGKEVAKLDLVVSPVQDGASTYQGSSQGEKAVADVCAGLALQAAAAGRAQFDLAFYDEVFDALDASVAERVLALLRQEGKERNVFVFSHAEWLKGESFDRFVMVSKDAGVSSFVGKEK